MQHFQADGHRGVNEAQKKRKEIITETTKSHVGAFMRLPL
jgi:hypothetical protein